MSAESERLKKYKKVVEQLFAVREPMLSQWKKISRLILPQRGMYPGGSNDAKSLYTERNKEIVTRAATSALRKSAAGFTSGMTPESLPWVKWGLRDQALEEREGVRVWLDYVENSARFLLKMSGFYQAIHTANQELLSFGCMLLSMDSSPATLARFTCPTNGTYAVALNGEGALSTVARVVRYSPKQLADLFGKEALSSYTKTMLDKEPFKELDITHLVQPRDNYDPTKIDAKNMRWESVFYESDNGAQDVLHVGGYHEMPYMFASWDDGLTIYGTGPGDEALPDISQLQCVETQLLTAMDKMINPPMRVPSNFKSPINDYAGGKTAIAASVEADAFAPLYRTEPNIVPMLNKSQELVTRINDTLLASVFTDLPLELRPKDMSATEYMERKRERLQMMGPTLASYEPRVLVPVLERAYGLLDRAGVLPPVPAILAESEGAIVNFDFQSPLAQAMSATKGAATRGFLVDLVQIASMSPDVLMKVDLMQAVDEMAKGNSVPGRVIRSDDAVEALMAAKAEAEQKQQAMMEQQAMVKQLTDVAKVPAGPDSMLRQAAGAQQQ